MSSVFVPKQANPQEANRIINMIIDKEIKSWPSGDRSFVLPSDSRLKAGSVTAKIGVRDPEVTRMLLLKSTATSEEAVSRIKTGLLTPSRRIDKVLEITLESPHRAISKRSRESIAEPPNRGKLEGKRTSEGIPLFFPKKSSEEFGLYEGFNYNRACEKWNRPVRSGAEVTYAQQYYKVMGMGPYSNKARV